MALLLSIVPVVRLAARLAASPFWLDRRLRDGDVHILTASTLRLTGPEPPVPQRPLEMDAPCAICSFAPCTPTTEISPNRGTSVPRGLDRPAASPTALQVQALPDMGHAGSYRPLPYRFSPLLP